MIFIGAGIRHFMILGSKGKNGYPWLVPVALALVGVVVLSGSKRPEAPAAATAPAGSSSRSGPPRGTSRASGRRAPPRDRRPEDIQ